MKAALIKAPYKIKLVEKEMPEIEPGYALIEVKACSVCGGDLDIARKSQEFAAFGHEISGIVRAVGEGVSSVKKGDKVAVETTRFCGRCSPCRNGHPELCENTEWFTRHKAGGFADYIAVHEKNLVVFEGLSFEQAALVEPLGVAADLVYTAEIGINDSVLIVGLGAIGLMSLQLIKYKTAGVVCAVGSSASLAKIRAAQKIGIDDISFYDKEDAKSHSFPVEKFDRILITSPPDTIPKYFELASFGGIIAYLGFGGNSEIAIDAHLFHVRRLSLKASFAAPALFFPMCIDLIKRGKVDVEGLISHRFTLEEMAQVMENLGQNSAELIKAVMIRND